jgi:hypothetical protein
VKSKNKESEGKWPIPNANDHQRQKKKSAVTSFSSQSLLRFFSILTGTQGVWKVSAGKFYNDAEADKGLQTTQGKRQK